MKGNFYRKDQDQLSCVEQDIALPEFDGEKGVAALRDVLLFYRRNYRLGTAAAKNRGQVSGSGKKPYRQKGTGMARHGEKRSPIWRGGGVVFGPTGRDYSVKINKKVRQLALGRTVFDHLQEKTITFVDEFALDAPKTSEMVKFLSNFGFQDGETVLLVDMNFSPEVILAARNLPNVFMMDAASLNAWDMCYCNQILMSENGLRVLEERLMVKK